ncbi:MAG TPA: hypothetical protein VJN42_09325 [Candidatus Acidoferrum sp.]|nr:hypothetical protein [Candidatus Acidoferrum sp.]
MRRLGVMVAVASFAVYASPLHGQARGGSMGHASTGGQRFAVPHPAAHFSTPMMGSHAAGMSQVPAGSRWVRTSSGMLVLHVPRSRVGGIGRGAGTTRRVLSQDVPGLGFDFPHFAATHQGGPDFRDRDRFRNQRFVGVFFPFFGGGGSWPLFPEDVDEEPPPEYPPQEVAEAAPPAAPNSGYEYPRPYGPRGLEQAPAPSAAAPAAAEPEPEKPNDQFVFVRRDGTLFFAVAYMWENGTLRYITSEGLRRTVAGSTLDLNATQEFNEQRGLSFHSPA